MTWQDVQHHYIEWEPPDLPICGRLLVGRGSDTFDPRCVKPPGHEGLCLGAKGEDVMAGER